MSTIKHPVGPQPPEVYRRRRLWVLLGAVAVIVIIILIIVGVANGKSKAGATPKTAVSQSAVPKPAASAAGAAAACIPSRLKLEAVTDKTVYAAGAQPLINMKLTNIGSTPCTVNFGSTQQELIVTSGTEKIWDSKDCQTAPVDAPTVLQPNVAAVTATIPWDRTRSATTTCTTSRAAVTAGGASYHLQAKLGTLASTATVQFILN